MIGSCQATPLKQSTCSLSSHFGTSIFTAQSNGELSTVRSCMTTSRPCGPPDHESPSHPPDHESSATSRLATASGDPAVVIAGEQSTGPSDSLGPALNIKTQMDQQERLSEYGEERAEYPVAKREEGLTLLLHCYSWLWICGPDKRGLRRPVLDRKGADAEPGPWGRG